MTFDRHDASISPSQAIPANAVAYIKRHGSMVSEAGGVVLYAMNVETATALAALLMDQDDAGWSYDGSQIYDKCERVRVMRSLLGIFGSDLRAGE